MKQLIYILLCLLLTACHDEADSPSTALVGRSMRFEATVMEKPQTRGQVLEMNDNNITHDFEPGDSFGLFIIDGSDHFVTEIDGHTALNIKLTTPDGKAWNIDSDIKEVVHKLGYRYMAYYPYSEAFNNCMSKADIQALLTPPATDQSTQAATDWMYTDITPPGINAVTTLKFMHRYAKIDIYNSFTQEHKNNWATKYQFTKTVDDSKVEHYRYILNEPTGTTLSINGTYTIGNELTGMKEFKYECDNITIQNGRHAIVYTYRMDERCAIDLGLPSGIKWSPINLGTETPTYMDETAIAAASNQLGKRLAWGELFEKDSYSYATYINDPYNETKTSLLPTDIAETVYDPVRQYWGGHWTLPSSADMKELISYTDSIKTESVYSTELGKNVNKVTRRSKINGNEITLISNGYVGNATVYKNEFLYYMSANRSNLTSCVILNDNPWGTYNFNRYYGMNIRPVLKDRYVYTYADKKDIIVRHINVLAVDLGITKEVVTEEGKTVTYKLLWSPFNYGVESKVDLQTYNRAPIDEDAFLDKCLTQPGMRLAWGDLEERTAFNTVEYKKSAIAAKYNWDNTASTDKDTRDLLPEDDIVQQNWPEGWSIPTAKDFELLCNNTNVTTETINGKTWFRMTSKSNGNSILIPGTHYIDDADNTEKWNTPAYLQSSTIGLKGDKPTIYALQLSGTSGSVPSSAGRPTGLMVRPVRYVRVN